MEDYSDKQTDENYGEKQEEVDNDNMEKDAYNEKKKRNSESKRKLWQSNINKMDNRGRPRLATTKLGKGEGALY